MRKAQSCWEPYMYIMLVKSIDFITAEDKLLFSLLKSLYTSFLLQENAILLISLQRLPAGRRLHW